jgi:two-component system LytT family sensor kinase
VAIDLKNFFSKIRAAATEHLYVICIGSMACIFLYWVFFNFAPPYQAVHIPEITGGVLNLKEQDLKKEGGVLLDGEWEFYWNSLKSPGDFADARAPEENRIYMKVPGYWNGKDVEGKRLSGDGYATYRLTVRFDRPVRQLAIKVDAVFSSYRMWIGNKEVLSCGTTGASAESSKAGMEALLAFYDAGEAGETEIQILIQVSNFIGGKGGILKSVTMGTVKQIQNIRQRNLMTDVFIFSSTIFMGFFYLLLFNFRKKERYVLYFGILCVLISLRSLFLGELCIYSLLSGYDPVALFKFSFFILAFALPLFVVYYDKMFPYEMPGSFKRITSALGSVFIISVFFLPYRYVYWILYGFEAYTLFVFVLLGIITVNLIRKRREGFMIVGIGSVIILLSALNDMLSDLLAIQGKFYTTKGLFVFMMLQCLLLSRRFAGSQRIAEQFQEAEIRSLQAQIKPHFLFNSITTIAYWIQKDAPKAHSLLLDLSDYMRSRFSFGSSDDMVEFQDEMYHVKSYLNLQQARLEGRLKVIFDIDPDIKVKIPALLIQPIVENALKHGILPGNEGGILKISAVCRKRCLTVVIEDNGAGMAPERLKDLLDEKVPGYGIGVRNVNKRLQHFYGRTLAVESEEGKGTTVKMEIPL